LPEGEESREPHSRHFQQPFPFVSASFQQDSPGVLDFTRSADESRRVERVHELFAVFRIVVHFIRAA
jgi:hypothetical protein